MVRQKKVINFAVANKNFGSLAQLNRASDYGSEGYRFESCRSHKEVQLSVVPLFLLYTPHISFTFFDYFCRMILDILFLIGGLALILVGANMLTDGSSDLARRMGISELVVGLTVVAFGTSTPELVISIISAVKGTSELAIGNVVGSNIFNICAIIGIVALIKPMKVSHNIMNNEIPLVFLSSLILLIMGNGPFLDSEPAMILSRVDGILLILFFILFMRHTLSQAKSGNTSGENEDQKPPMKIAKAILFVILGLAGLIFGGDIFVDGATGIAKALGVSDAVIALTIVAAGTSLPELAVSITAALKGKPELALGNVIGSNIFNIFLVLGASATIFPLKFGAIGNVDLLTLLLASALFWIFGRFFKYNTITRTEGGILATVYIAYTMWLISNA